MRLHRCSAVARLAIPQFGVLGTECCALRRQAVLDDALCSLICVHRRFLVACGHREELSPDNCARRASGTTECSCRPQLAQPQVDFRLEPALPTDKVRL